MQRAYGYLSVVVAVVVGVFWSSLSTFWSGQLQQWVSGNLSAPDHETWAQVQVEGVSQEEDDEQRHSQQELPDRYG